MKVKLLSQRIISSLIYREGSEQGANQQSTLLSFIFIIYCLFSFQQAVAIETIELSIEQISLEQLLNQTQSQDLAQNSNLNNKKQLLEQLKINQLFVTMDLTSSPVRFKIDLSKLKLPSPYKEVKSLNLSCLNFVLIPDKLECKKGKLAFEGLFDQPVTTVDISFIYNSSEDILNLSLKNINLGSGSASVEFIINSDKWQSNFKTHKLEYKFLSRYIKAFFYQEKMKDVINKLESAGGVLSLSGQASGVLAANDREENKLHTLKLKGKLEQVHYQYVENLAEQLSFNFAVNLNSISNNVQNISLMIDFLGGEVLHNDNYVVFNGKESLHADLKINTEGMIEVSGFELNSKGIFTLGSQGKFLTNDKMAVQYLDSKLSIKNLTLFNKHYLNNIISGTDYEDLIVEGGLEVKFSSKLKHKKNKYKVDVRLDNFSMALSEQISLLELNGSIFWNNYNQINFPVESSHLTWQELTLNGLPLGYSDFKFNLHNDYLKLLKETDIPIFDGALHINNLEISHLFPVEHYDTGKSKKSGKDSLTLTVDGMIKPVSLALLSNHFQWPLLDGTLSAVIPSTSYNEKYLRVGGAMMLQVFDGIVIIKDLKIEEPLKDYAQLFANIDLNNLNLKSLTKTYNFGEINGRVEGKLKALELSAWEPVAFDAYIRTPKNDDSSHRISQRAIDNLSSLGGASGLLSRSFLSFFETFRYDKIGLSCRLRNNVCHMSGVETKGNSYYIVKGGGIPRIDVMGFQRKVNWGVLTSRLKAIQLANEAVIE